VPTGNEDNFQGLGDTTLQPFLTASDEIGPVDLHASAGIDVDFENSDRSRVRYGAGATYQALKNVAILFDVLGSSNIESERLTVEVPQFVNGRDPNNQAISDVVVGRQKFSTDVRTDIVDVAPGVKVSLPHNSVAFVQVLVPVNDDGLRADFIPAGGFEVTF
jgi:hypothetical protein